MSQIKTQGLIIKAINLNDNDKIFTVLTREGEKISLMSKGIRSQKHKDFSALQLFCYSDFVIEKRGAIGYVSGATVINNFFGIRDSVEKVAFSAYICALLNAIPDDTGICDEFYSFILNTLYLTQKITGSDITLKSGILKLKVIFELCLVKELGFMPDCTSCAKCGAKKDIKYFDICTGSVYCDKCYENVMSPSLVPLDDGSYKILVFILNTNDLRAVFKAEGNAMYLEHLSNLSEMYLQYHTELAPTELYYLKKLLKIG